MKGLLIHSIKHNKKIEMIYLSSDHHISQRVIRVLKMNSELILAYCYTKRKVRTFKIENILSVVPAGKKLGA